MLAPLDGGPFAALDAALQREAIGRLLELPDDVALPDPRALVPTMAEIGSRHEQLDLLYVEAAAEAVLLEAEVWLSEPAARGALPAVLEAERRDWRSIPLG